MLPLEVTLSVPPLARVQVRLVLPLSVVAPLLAQLPAASAYGEIRLASPKATAAPSALRVEEGLPRDLACSEVTMKAWRESLQTTQWALFMQRLPCSWKKFE
jgi:hypothetical protein